MLKIFKFLVNYVGTDLYFKSQQLTIGIGRGRELRSTISFIQRGCSIIFVLAGSKRISTFSPPQMR